MAAWTRAPGGVGNVRRVIDHTETVWWLTPASLATSNMDGRLLGLRLVTILPNLPAGGRHPCTASLVP